MKQLIQPLFEGPVDVVGDIHGEYSALRALLRALGYDEGVHPEGRRLVFVGDLVDRGPDSPGVVELVAGYCERGLAQCILGNHELNLLNQESKHGNEWFMRAEAPPETWSVPGGRAVTPAQRARFQAFFDERPLALEREDLRVVHACWSAEAIEALERRGPVEGVASAYRSYNEAVVASLESDGVLARRRAALLSHGLHDRSQPPAWLESVAENDLRRQLGNPIRVLTSGPEVAAMPPFWASGKWRMVSREPWWERYGGEKPVIIGHYWRRPPGIEHEADGGPDLFASVAPEAWMGPAREVFCVDYSVGQRYLERRDGAGEGGFIRRLAAVRVPEWTLHYDDGRVSAIGSPGGV